MQGGSDRHHYYFPKKLYRGNRIMTISYAFHHVFHNYFMAQCKKPHIRSCRLSECKYQDICCYHGTDVEFGKRVPWGEVT